MKVNEIIVDFLIYWMYNKVPISIIHFRLDDFFNVKISRQNLMDYINTSIQPLLDSFRDNNQEPAMPFNDDELKRIAKRIAKGETDIPIEEIKEEARDGGMEINFSEVLKAMEDEFARETINNDRRSFPLYTVRRDRDGYPFNTDPWRTARWQNTYVDKGSEEGDRTAYVVAKKMSFEEKQDLEADRLRKQAEELKVFDKPKRKLDLED